ncbi:hypothetical protein Mp_3g24600 [Marchantia polymorpha subsp. ruderalis]|uniref:Uncharacterized protein n=2 Tax=Marchantia polymorpha TaxID=3197 RepID=A0AAF6B4E2_MARPO|nr:hypothetical protein MARPO_0224s0004 [Marchantia polymorpha]BBN06876.1 hypothetical protein Mp_3g24600 [Marchantia polymorpha subsp. ruderalis]|eukprot:PTQ27087.1 hypothetical protein MARPO_0224s0004 [Marchantia polymorpha]
MNRGELIGIVEKRAEVASEGLDGGWSSLQSVKLVRTEGRVGLQRQHEDRGKSTLPIADSRHRKWSFAKMPSRFNKTSEAGSRSLGLGTSECGVPSTQRLLSVSRVSKTCRRHMVFERKYSRVHGLHSRLSHRLRQQ